MRTPHNSYVAFIVFLFILIARAEGGMEGSFVSQEKASSKRM